ncbi:hypothetical protein J6590_089188 [Homalodisca vitripennis]|nr:hypothetical protein J6590_089188 [Homalodisca vitripennis]
MDEEINENNDVLPEGEERENNANVINEGEHFEDPNANQGLLRGTTSIDQPQGERTPPNFDLDQPLEPIDYFTKCIPESIIKTMVDMTNLYALQRAVTLIDSVHIVSKVPTFSLQLDSQNSFPKLSHICQSFKCHNY